MEVCDCGEMINPIDLIFNHALERAVKWFVRQQTSGAECGELQETKQEVDIDRLGQMLLDEAREEAEKQKQQRSSVKKEEDPEKFNP